jgi:predicted aconitase with swiveling domain
MDGRALRGRVISKGKAAGEALVSRDPLSFFGGVSLSGIVVENHHPLEGQSIAGKVLVFPSLKGSAAGMWILYRLAKEGRAPIAMVVTEADAILAAGTIFGDIPTMDHFDNDPFLFIKSGDRIIVDAMEGFVTTDV